MTAPCLFDLSRIDFAKAWLFERRKHYSANSDMWDLCRHWETLKHTLLDELNSGRYEFEPLQRYEIDGGGYISLWSSRDMIALKMISLTLSELMTDYLPKTCYHIKGSGGLKHAVNLTHAAAQHHTFVFRTDIKGYYESLRFDVLMNIIQPM